MTRLDYIQAIAGLALIGLGAWFYIAPAAALGIVGLLLLADARFGSGH